ncbi:hypothetical protein PR048_010312 [Dryococelus australis]|uniref:Ig-like domain-containing protein n=1 Tax=Dryococelus australis TaxID=614101 RepID=A0ABQ9I2F1_9NEOP|nr:hypothetical protein PR048_010312 [Dryococelus australis]
MREQGKQEIPEKTHRPTASSGTIFICENPVTRPGIEPGSPWWEASVLIAQPSWPHLASSCEAERSQCIQLHSLHNSSTYVRDIVGDVPLRLSALMEVNIGLCVVSIVDNPQRWHKLSHFVQLTDFERGRIVGLREAGWPFRRIAHRVGPHDRQTGSAQHRYTYSRLDRRIRRAAIADRTATAPQIRATVAPKVSAKTITNCLLDDGLRSSSAYCCCSYNAKEVSSSSRTIPTHTRLMLHNGLSKMFVNSPGQHDHPTVREVWGWVLQASSQSGAGRMTGHGRGGGGAGGQLVTTERRAVGALALCCFALGLRADDCPLLCDCKWKGNKESVICLNASLAAVPRRLGAGTQVLNLTDNPLSSLGKDAFLSAGLLNLQRIHLVRCRLKTLDRHAFRKLTNLVELDLSYNLLPSVPSHVLDSISELRELRLSGNPIQRVVNEAFSSVPQLVRLELSHCRIGTLEPRAFAGLEQSLEWLKIDGNHLVQLKPSTIVTLGNLHGVELADNPWNCTCALRPLREWMQQKNVPFGAPPVCRYPRRLADKSWTRLELDDFACAPRISALAPVIGGVEGHNVTMACAVGGVPRPRVKWMWRNRVVGNASGSPGRRAAYVVHATDEGSNLTVVSAEVQDAGTYVCAAENKAGRAEASVALSVARRPADVGLSGRVLVASIIVAALFLLASCLVALCVCGVRRRAHPSLSSPAASRRHDDSYEKIEMNHKGASMANHTGGAAVGADAPGTEAASPERRRRHLRAEYHGVPSVDTEEEGDQEDDDEETPTPSTLVAAAKVLWARSSEDTASGSHTHSDASDVKCSAMSDHVDLHIPRSISYLDRRLLASHLCEPGLIPGGFTCGNRGGRCRWSAGSLGDLPFPPPLHCGAAPYSPRFTLIEYQDLDIKSELGSIPGGVTPDFCNRQSCPCIPAPLDTQLSSSTLKSSMDELLSPQDTTSSLLLHSDTPNSAARSQPPAVVVAPLSVPQHVMRKQTLGAGGSLYTSAPLEPSPAADRVDKNYPDLLEISPLNASYAGVGAAGAATADSSFCTLPRKRGGALERGRVSARYYRYGTTGCDSQSPLLPDSRYGSSGEGSGSSSASVRRSSIDSYSSYYPLSRDKHSPVAHQRSSSFLNLASPGVSVASGDSGLTPTTSGARKVPSLPASPVLDRVQAATPLLNIVGTSAGGGREAYPLSAPSAVAAANTYDYHAAQLERFLEEYRSLQEQLCKMKETCENIHHHEPTRYGSEALRYGASTPTSDEGGLNPKSILKNKASSVAVTATSASSPMSGGALPDSPSSLSGGAVDYGSDLPSYWLPRNPLLRRYSGGDFFQS